MGSGASRICGFSVASKNAPPPKAKSKVVFQ
jgi:hypothetical protein